MRPSRPLSGGGGGIVSPFGEWEARVGERWYVSCYQHAFSICANPLTLCEYERAQIRLK